MIYAYPRFLQVFGYNKWINTGCALHSKDTLREAFAFSVCYSDSVKGVESVLAFADENQTSLLSLWFTCTFLVSCTFSVTVSTSCWRPCTWKYLFHVISHTSLKTSVSNCWPVVVYLTRDCCDMEMKILYQKKKKNIWVFSFCLWKLKMF